MLYHEKVGLPKFSLPDMLNLHYSPHAKKASKTDRYGDIQLAPALETKKCQIVELETCDYDEEIIKVLVRQAYNDRLDLCTVIALNRQIEGAFLVKTVWLNEKSDKHDSLDITKYSKPSKAS